jgi:hypothetical protein
MVEDLGVARGTGGGDGYSRNCEVNNEGNEANHTV